MDGVGDTKNRNIHLHLHDLKAKILSSKCRDPHSGYWSVGRIKGQKREKLAIGYQTTVVRNISVPSIAQLGDYRL